LLEHCVQGQGHPGCRVHASGAPARSTVACARTGQQPGDPPPHPGGCALVHATRTRSTVHACTHACAVQLAAKEEAHAFARLPKGCKLCALCSRKHWGRTCGRGGRKKGMRN
jgi:hypothetical protein